jgi:hypothetical protein
MDLSFIIVTQMFVFSDFFFFFFSIYIFRW